MDIKFGCVCFMVLTQNKNVAVNLMAPRALCRITHVLVDTWMLTVKLVYKVSNVPDDLKWATNTHMTPFILTFKA